MLASLRGWALMKNIAALRWKRPHKPLASSWERGRATKCRPKLAGIGPSANKRCTEPSPPLWVTKCYGNISCWPTHVYQRINFYWTFAAQMYLPNGCCKFFVRRLSNVSLSKGEGNSPAGIERWKHRRQWIFGQVLNIRKQFRRNAAGVENDFVPLQSNRYRTFFVRKRNKSKSPI